VLTRTINEKIILGPKLETLQRELVNHKKRVRKANELYEELKKMVQDIKEVV